MTIKKQRLKSKPEIKITFDIEKKDAQDAVSINLLSEHNQWEPIEFTVLKSGKFKLAINVSTAEATNFQYIFQATNSDNHQFMLLPEDADGHTDNGMGDGGQNAIMELS